MASRTALEKDAPKSGTHQNPHKILIKATLLVTSTFTVMAAAMMAPSLPAMQAHFAEVENVALLVRLVLTIPALFIVVGAPMAGFIVDRYGRKSLLIISTLLYGLAGGSGFVLSTLTGILIGRALLGLAVAGVMTSVTTLIADYYTGTSRAQFLGFQAAFVGLGATFFLIIGGFLADLHWRNPFLIYLTAFAVLPFIIFVLYEPERPRFIPSSPSPTPGDPANALEIKPDYGLGESHSGEQDENLSSPIKLLALIYSIILLLQVIFYMIPVQLPFYLQTLMGADAKQSGLAISMMAFFYASGSLMSARVSRSVNRINIIVLSFSIIGLGYGIIGSVGIYGLILFGLATGGLGYGFLIPNLTVWLAAETPERLRGRALGGLTTFTFLGQFLSPIITQPVIQRFDLAVTYVLSGGLLLLIAAFIFVRNKVR